MVNVLRIMLLRVMLIVISCFFRLVLLDMILSFNQLMLVCFGCFGYKINAKSFTRNMKNCHEYAWKWPSSYNDTYYTVLHLKIRWHTGEEIHHPTIESYVSFIRPSCPSGLKAWHSKMAPEISQKHEFSSSWKKNKHLQVQNSFLTLLDKISDLI